MNAPDQAETEAIVAALAVLIAKYENLASIETARFVRAQDVVADLRHVSSPPDPTTGREADDE